MSDAEWAVIEPLLPGPGWQRGQGGSPGKHCRRDIVNGIRYLTHNGPVWRAMPADLPHWRTVYHYVRAWQASGATRRLHDELREAVRVLAGRSPAPTAAVINVIGLLLSVVVTAASVQDRDGARPLLWRLAADFRAVTWYGPTAATPASSSPGPGIRSTAGCRSSSAPVTCTPSTSCPAAG